MKKIWISLPITLVSLLVHIEKPPNTVACGGFQNDLVDHIQAQLDQTKEFRIARCVNPRVSNQSRLTNRQCQNCDLRGLTISQEDFTSTNLHNADLSAARIFSVTLADANLQNANLYAASLHWVDMSGADLSNSQLTGVTMRQSNLDSVNFQNADLRLAVFERVELHNAENLAYEQLVGPNQPFLCHVTLPETLNRVDPNRDCSAIDAVINERERIRREGR